MQPTFTLGIALDAAGAALPLQETSDFSDSPYKITAVESALALIFTSHLG